MHSEIQVLPEQPGTEGAALQRAQSPTVRAYRCVGMNASLDGKITASTVCESTDVDGDKRLTYFSTGDGKVTRTFVAGTGKYEGMVTAGTVQPLGPFPVIKAGTFQDCNNQTGTYKLK